MNVLIFTLYSHATVVLLNRLVGLLSRSIFVIKIKSALIMKSDWSRS